MIRASMGFKVALVIVSAALFLTFSRLSLSLLVPGAIGVALVLFGIVIGYRPAAVLGLLVDLVVAALSIEITTMANVDVWQTSILGLLLPTALLAWAALLSEDGAGSEIRFRTSAFGIALVAGVTFALVLPVSMALMRVIFPDMAATLSTMAEISILFVVVAVVAVALTWPTNEESLAEGGEIA